VLNLRVSRCRHKIDELRRDLERLAPGNTKNPDTVQSLEFQKQAQRAHLLEGTQNVSYMSNALQTTHSIALDTERIGEDALKDLAVQRGVIEGGINDLDNVGDQVDSVRGRLGVMGRRLIGDKVILIVVIILLVIAICVTIFLRWILPIIREHDANNPPTPMPTPPPIPTPTPLPIPPPTPTPTPTPTPLPIPPPTPTPTPTPSPSPTSLFGFK